MSPRGIYPRKRRAATTAAVAPTTPAQDAPTAVAVISAKTQKMIDHVKDTFHAFVGDFAGLTKRRADLAPPFMKAFNSWATESGGNFVAFVRMLDPTVPEQAQAYRAHRAFQAADYLRRLVSRQQASARREEVAAPGAPRVATPIEAFAALCVSIVPLVKDADVLWKALRDELHWTDQQVHRVQALVSHSAPLLRGPKVVEKPILRLAS